MGWVFGAVAVLIGLGVLSLVMGGARAKHPKAGAGDTGRDANTAAQDTPPQEAEEAFAALAARLEALARPAVPVIVTDQQTTGLWESRLGGPPAWPKGHPRPAGQGQAPLCFLAQINFADMPPLEGFPREGLLQLYFEADDLYGMSFPGEGGEGDIPRSRIRVFVHPPESELALWHQFASEDEVVHLATPFDYLEWWQHGLALQFGAITAMTPRFEDHLIHDEARAVSTLFGHSQDFFNRLEALMGQGLSGIVIGGHPYFSQMDPRYGFEAQRVFTKTLISFDSVHPYLMWGDVGTGSFLIREDTEMAGDITDVLFNYDCC